MAKKRDQKQNIEIASRARYVARQCAGRLFACRDGLFLVSGRPDFNRLLQCLSAYPSPPEKGNEPGPIECGFRPVDIARITSTNLAYWSRSLQKWRKLTEEQKQLKQKNASDRKKLAAWDDQISFLSHRLEVIYTEFNRITGDPEPETAYIPADAAQTDISLLLKTMMPADHLPVITWYAAMVAWIGGKTAAVRFLAGINPHLQHPLYDELNALLIKLNAFEKQLQSLDQKKINQSYFEPAYESIAEQVKKELNGLSPQLSRELGKQDITRTAYKDIVDINKRLIHDCNNALQKITPEKLRQRMAGGAALCAMDESSQPLPECLFNRIKNREHLNAILKALCELHPDKGYHQLLQLLDDIWDVIHPSDLSDALKLVNCGATAADIAWLHDIHVPLDDYVEMFPKRLLPPGPVRILARYLESTGARSTSEELNKIFTITGNEGSMHVAEAFHEMISSIPEEQLSDQLPQTCWNTFVAAISISSLGDRARSRINRWAHPSNHKEIMPDLPDAIGKDVKAWCNRLAFYQRLGGKEPALTKSLLNLLRKAEKESGELAHLKSLEASGQLDEKARRRLKSLLSRSLAAGTTGARFLKKAKEVCARQSLESLQQIIKTEAAREFQRRLKVEMPGYLKPFQAADLFNWINSLPEQSQKHLKELVDTWKVHGENYKAHLSENKRWVSRVLKDNPLDTAWLNPRPAEIKIDGNTFLLKAAHDPFRVFFMGSTFDTCLSIPAGSNNFSVLTNAYEYNKTVLFVFDETGTPVARKLIVINTEAQMVGYRTYCTARGETRETLENFIDGYCGGLARSCGLSLSNSGRPENITSMDWYDDGIEPWPPIAYKVFEQAFEPEKALFFEDSQISPKLKNAALQYQDKIIDTLKSIRLWPPDEGKNLENVLTESPGLIEETLAIVARKEHNLELAVLMCQIASTEGGILEANTSLGKIQGESVYETLLAYSRQYYLDVRRERIAALLIEWDTPASINLLSRMCLPEESAALWNLPYAAIQSKTAAQTIQNFLIKERYWYCEDETLLLLIACIQTTLGKNPPDSLIIKLFQHDNAEDENVTCSLQQICLSMAQWLPPLRRPGRQLTTKILEKVWNNRELERSFPEAFSDNRLGAILWCLKNPCPASRKFLRLYAPENAAALLALAILNPVKFSGLVHKIVPGMAAEPAAIMAVYLMDGIPEGRAFIQSLEASFPNQGTVCNAVARMYQAMENLDWPELLNAQLNLKLYDYRSCLPFLMHNVWENLARAEKIEAIFPFADEDTAEKAYEAIHNSGMNLFGLLLLLTKRLANCAPSEEDRVRGVIHLLLARRGWDGEKRLWLDVVSSRRLYHEQLEPRPVNTSLHFTREMEYCGAYDLFFDAAGNRRCTAMLNWNYGVFSFPENLDQACRLTQLLVEKADDRDPTKHSGFEPQTEIQKRLIEMWQDNL